MSLPASLHQIAIDLTPTLPGGANGGVRLLAIELLQHLAKLHPECQFTVLTSDICHEQLKILDASNVTRQCALYTNHSSTANPDKIVNLKSRLRSSLQTALPQSAYLRLKSAWSRLNYSRQGHSRSNTLISGLIPDLLFCPYGAPTYAVPDIPVVSVIVDLQFRSYPDFFTADDLYYRDLHFRDACTKADSLVCISDYVRQTVIRNSEFPPDKIEMIHITLPRRVPYLPNDEAVVILNQWRLVPGSFLLYPANFWLHKNHETLLEAFARFAQCNPSSDLKLVCCGHPDARATEVQLKASAAGLSDRVIFPGYVSNDEFASLLQSCRAVIFPSLYEGFGMPVLEAMAAGKPVACSNVTSLPEVAGDAALYFDPHKADEIAQTIEQIQYDMALLDQMVKRGLKRAADLGDAETMANKYWKVFERTVTSRAAIS